ncbi:DivIVA domain-containing protein [Micromonospora sp. NPDC049230]|uniref:DivIVA domain-containing protein n=1 Tax=Micromonospora sp. NPDC049230 TaxID=3155502 RepID=UPI003405B0F8
MGQLLLLLVVALTVAAVVFGVTVLVSGRDPGLVPAEPDSQAVALPGTRPLRESDVGAVRFDTALRGYRMSQVDQAMRRAAYDIGYKSELIGVLEAEVAALREGRTDDADVLRDAREQSASKAASADAAQPDAAQPDAAQPDAAQPDAAQPDGAEPDVAAASPTDEAGSGATPVGATGTGPLPAATSSPADSDGVAVVSASDEPADREQTDGTPAAGTGQHGATVRSESA